ncbi:hypothetical protein PLICRDRAFT_48571 [Plicaturopsis crispa FD-325 SS-3]|nr:hypothetical protein PLICRDRAFT_48571 [Plicaturopsis crispa FD-325 SS-3]
MGPGKSDVDTKVSTFTRQKSRIALGVTRSNFPQIDASLDSIPRDLHGGLSHAYESIRDGLNRAMPIVENATSVADETVDMFERDLRHMTKGVEITPWYDYWTVYQFLNGPTQTAIFRATLLAMREVEPVLRDRVRHIHIIHDNIQNLAYYVEWYTSTPPSFREKYHASAINTFTQEYTAAQKLFSEFRELSFVANTAAADYTAPSSRLPYRMSLREGLFSPNIPRIEKL